jgi:anti-sigma B factor antagonist
MQQLAIDSELTIYTAGEQKANLLSFLNSGNDLELNLANVSDFDTAGMQLLILLKREAAQHGKKLTFVMHSKAVIEALELANLTNTFGDQVVLSSHGG